MNNIHHKEKKYAQIPDAIMENILGYVDADISLHFQKRYPNLIRRMQITKPARQTTKAIANHMATEG